EARRRRVVRGEVGVYNVFTRLVAQGTDAEGVQRALGLPLEEHRVDLVRDVLPEDEAMRQPLERVVVELQAPGAAVQTRVRLDLRRLPRRRRIPAAVRRPVRVPPADATDDGVRRRRVTEPRRGAVDAQAERDLEVLPDEGVEV